MIPGEDETVSEIDDAALFALAAGDAEAEVKQDAPAKAGVEAEKAPAEGQPGGDPPKQAPPEPEHRVPLSELLDERQKRQETARQYAEMQRQYAEMQRQMEALRNPQKPVDLFADPQGFQESLEQRLERQQHEFEQRIRVHAIDTSFSFAARQHGEEFQKAFGAFEEVAGALKGNDVMLRNRIVNAPDPGEAMMQWYRSRQILQESGGDLNAYREKLLQQERERLAKDPEFRKQVIEGLRTEAASRPPVTQMPSLNRAPAAASNAGDDERDLGDAELFSYATTRRRR